MPATLQQIQAKLNEAIALRDDAQQTHALLSLSTGGIDTTTSQTLNAKLNGYQREVELLMKCERDLIANGRLDAETARLAVTAAPGAPAPQLQCAESRFNASEAPNAVLTPPARSGAQMTPREAPRGEVSEPPLPASGDVF